MLGRQDYTAYLSGAMAARRPAAAAIPAGLVWLPRSSPSWP